jgi:hypothetical protein
MPRHRTATRCAYGAGDWPNASAGTCSDGVGIRSKAGCATRRLTHDCAVIYVCGEAGRMEPDVRKAVTYIDASTTGASE